MKEGVKRTNYWIWTIVTIIAGVLTYVFAAVYDRILELRSEFYLMEEWNSGLTFNGRFFRENFSVVIFIVAAVAFCVGLLALVLSNVFCGRKGADGKIKLHWIDYIFTEIQVVIIGIIAFVSMLILKIAYYYVPNFFVEKIILVKNPIEVYDAKGDGPTNIIKSLVDAQAIDKNYVVSSYYDETVNYVAITILCIVAIALLIFAEMMLIQSIVRKTKARQGMRHSIVGCIILGINKGLDKKNKFGQKLLVATVLFTGVFGVILFLVTLFSYNGYAAEFALFTAIVVIAAAIALELIFLPRLLNKYNKVRIGARELAGGNFKYKVDLPPKGEFGAFADNMNQISNAVKNALNKEYKSERMRTELISNVSHDLRTPLTSMITYIDLLKNEGLGSENAPEYLKIIDDKTNRLKQLTDDLFEAAKATSGDMKVKLEELDFREFVNQLLAEMGDIITESGNPVIVNDRLKDTHVMADGKMLWRVMENIFTNVAKYAAEGTRVYVDLYEKDRCNIIEVKNASKDQLNITTDELMERFTRGDDSRSTEGSGLGLAIARELSALMGGRFDIEIDGDLFKAKVILPKGGYRLNSRIRRKKSKLKPKERTARKGDTS